MIPMTIALLWLSIYGSATLATNDDLRTASQLDSFLSPQASIHFAGTPSFDTATERWQDWQPPHFLAAVEVATVKDVQRTVIDPLFLVS